MRPLAGIRVLDFSTLLPGPMATLLLAEAGADVIKVERPGGEDMRVFAPHWGDISATFALLNRGKKSIAVDLKDPATRDCIRDLAAKSDVVVLKPSEHVALVRDAVLTQCGTLGN